MTNPTLPCCLAVALFMGSMPGGVLAGWATGSVPSFQEAFSEETPPRDGDWRPHRLSRCRPHPSVRHDARAFFDEALDLYRNRGGGDAIVLLELALGELGNEPWLVLMLGQIYLLAGIGEPHCLPYSGPAAPRGDWPSDRLRLLERADLLLERLETSWPDDGLVAFLRADVARARDDHETAADLDHAGRSRCSHVDSLDLVAGMRDLVRRPARVTAPIVPEYPQAAARRRAQGEVVFDVLIDPRGRVAAAVPVGQADRDLVQAAREALDDGGYQVALVGYYPVWSWLRLSIRFVLDRP